MIDWSQQGNNSGIYPVWPWEDERISEAEYTYALESLERFLADVHVDELLTLEDVSSVASLVGHNVRILAIVRGKKLERQVERYATGTGELVSTLAKDYVFNKFSVDREVIVTASEGYSLISERRIVGFQGYQHEAMRVKLPSNKDIAIGNTPNVADQLCYAIDLRDGKRVEFHPVNSPENAQVQQGFADVLKAALQSLLLVLPEYRFNR